MALRDVARRTLAALNDLLGRPALRLPSVANPRLPAVESDAQWVTCNDHWFLRNVLPQPVSDRKLQLFAVACCRRIWHLIPLDATRRCIEVTERIADGRASSAELDAAIESSLDACEAELCLRHQPGQSWAGLEASAIGAATWVYHSESSGRSDTMADAAAAMAYGTMPPAAKSGLDPWEWDDGFERRRDAEYAAQADLFRDIFPNPFRPVPVVLPEWRTATVLALADAIYADRAFDRLPVLADALMEAGCDDAAILAHCCGPGPHVRGCWVVDLLLEKA